MHHSVLLHSTFMITSNIYDEVTKKNISIVILFIDDYLQSPRRTRTCPSCIPEDICRRPTRCPSSNVNTAARTRRLCPSTPLACPTNRCRKQGCHANIPLSGRVGFRVRLAIVATDCLARPEIRSNLLRRMPSGNTEILFWFTQKNRTDVAPWKSGSVTIRFPDRIMLMRTFVNTSFGTVSILLFATRKVRNSVAFPMAGEIYEIRLLSKSKCRVR